MDRILPGDRSHSSVAPPEAAAALFEAGLGHLLAGRFLDAQVCCEQALTADSSHADTLHLMGLLSLQAKQYDHAVEWIGRAIRQSPKAEYLSNLGMVLREQGRLDESLKVFDKAIQLQPDDPQLWHHLAGVLAALGRYADALLSWQHALELDPQHGEAAYRCGMLLHEAQRLEEALSYFDIGKKARPDHVAILQGRASCLRSLKRFEEGLADAMRADALDPADPISSNIAGNALLGLYRPEEALRWFDKALALQPSSAEIMLNKAGALIEVRRFEEALATYDHAAAVDPNNAKCVYYRSHLQLLTGHFEAGWQGREARWKVSGLPIIYPRFSQPMWLGNENIEGKTVLIYGDEGLGDTLQFARYVPMLVARGARVILVVLDALHLLLSEIPGIEQCRPYFSAGFPTTFDLYCPLMSLPLAFGTSLETIPPAEYLPPFAPDRVRAWEDRLGPHDRLRVGLVWSGNPNHSNDRHRSVRLPTMARLFDIGATFVSLQKDPRPHDKAFLTERNDIVDLTAHLTDFEETAALISCLDIVITVDTSVAHLAATLGRPTWILLPYLPDWRWLVDRDDSPWYPAARLFRQTATRDYGSVLERVRSELLAEVSKFGSA
jgi:tetratricopeptide (TPR) repeat protein